MLIRIFLSLTVLLLVSASPSASAHKMKSAFTIVLINERSGYLEVMHRFALHDAEEAALSLFKGKADIIDDEQTQSQFAQYIEEQFKIKDENKKDVPLQLVGFQNDAGYFWVYQDLKWQGQYNALNIKQLALTEIWSEQLNIVNIEFSGQTKTLTFSAHDNWQQVALH